MLIVLGVIFLLIVHATWGIYQKVRLSERKLNLAEQEYAILEEKRKSIEYKIERLNTETGIENEIRSKFDVVRDGEKIIVIVDPKETVAPPEEKPQGIRGFFTTLFSRFQ